MTIQPMTTKVIVDLPGDGLSVSKRQYAGAKSWIKILTGVDASKDTGFAFEGSFVRFGETVEVPEGTWFLSYIEDRSSGSGNLRGRDVTLYQVRGGELAEAGSWQPGAGKGWALRCRDDIAARLAGPAGPDRAALRGEAEQLWRRLRDISTILAQDLGSMVLCELATALPVPLRVGVLNDTGAVVVIADAPFTLLAAASSTTAVRMAFEHAEADQDRIQASICQGTDQP